ncbi:hypothetical protein [Nibricoccus sp. IMCC34717]|uniref:hypothetical protein n=1 Tax=Nibricoccus sp. IMCC34717 TaxID=3034021 RepID=UPI00384B01CA
MKRARAFTLLEIAVVTAILGLLSFLFLPSLANGIETQRIEAERVVLQTLADEVVRSFSVADPARNIAVLPSHSLGNAAATTWFDAGGARPSHVTGTEWYAKLARLRGDTVLIGEAVSREAQTALYQLGWNGVDQPRQLLAGPDEAGQQRYLLVSLVSPPTAALVMPPFDGTAALFEALWNHEWENPSADLPAEWLARLSPEEVARWREGRGTQSRVRCLRVQRIVQPKYRLLVNNTHATNSAWVDVEGITGAVVSAPASGVTASQEFLAGRLISIRRGATAPGNEVLRFHLHEETSVTIQP